MAIEFGSPEADALLEKNKKLQSRFDNGTAYECTYCKGKGCGICDQNGYIDEGVECTECEGKGGHYHQCDCEFCHKDDDWIDCEDCNGTGRVKD